MSAAPEPTVAATAPALVPGCLFDLGRPDPWLADDRLPAPPALDPLFRPRSVAVIGASRTRGSIGGEIFHNLIHTGFAGVVYPVNPKADVVQSVQAYPTIDDVPGPVDLAVIVVPALQVLEVLEACGRKRVRGAVVISAGFKETGPEGLERERALVECARQYGMRLVGPNCLGLLNTDPGVRLNATFAPIYPPAGRVAFSSQSGALGLAILEQAQQLGLGISQFVSVGNKADVSGSDLLEYWEHDPSVSVLLLYLESFGNPRRFAPIARRVSRVKPIVAVKSGRTAAGVRAAASHTGSLAGTDVAVDALCRQTGIIRTDTIEELFDVAMLLAHQPVPRGPRIGIVTNAGGPGIMASDACESHDLAIPALDGTTVAALRAFLAPEASTRNPVDMIASATPESYERAVRLMLDDPNVDAVLAIYVPPILTQRVTVAQAIVRGAMRAAEDARQSGRTVKPIVSCFMGSHGVPEDLQSLERAHIPSYPFPEAAAIALARAVAYGRWLERAPGSRPCFTDIDVRRAHATLGSPVSPTAAARGPSRWLDASAVRELLHAYGIAMPETIVARTATHAAEAAARIGGPVAIKLASRTIVHKSEVSGVVLDVRTPEEARRAFESIHATLARAGKADAMDGVIVQPMIADGAEAIIGVTVHPGFGPLIMFGLGGVMVELLADVAFRMHPLTDVDAHELVREVRGFRLLEGYRGGAPGDIGALEQTLLRVSQLVEDHPEITEMDLNPIKVFRPGHGCIAVDARIAVRTSASD